MNDSTYASYQTSLERAAAFAACGQFQDAIQVYTEAITVKIRFDVLAMRAQCYFSLQLYDKALHDLIMSIDLYPDELNDEDGLIKAHPQLYYNRAVVYTCLNRFPLAIRDFTRALRGNPSNSQVLLHRGVLYASISKYHKAIADLTKCMLLCRDKTSSKPTENEILALEFRGCSYAELGEYEASLADFDTALKHDPTDIQRLCGRAFVYAKTEQWEKSIEDLTAALKAWPEKETLFQRVIWKKSRPQSCSSINALQLHGAACIYNWRSSIYRKAQNFRESINDMNTAIQAIDKLHVPQLRLKARLLTNRSKLLILENEYECAWNDCMEALRNWPRCASAYHCCAQILEHKIEKVNRKDPQALHEAFQYLSAAIECDPWISNAYKERGKLFFQCDKLKYALADLKIARIVSPDDKEIQELIREAKFHLLDFS